MKKIFRVEGMHCESCVKMIQMELEGKVSKANIDYKKGIAEIEFDENKTNEKEIIESIKTAGYKVRK